MVMPRKLVDQQKSHLSNDEKLEREQTESKLYDFEPLSDQPPYFLNSTGKNEWKRIVPLLKSLPIANLDKSLLGAYCQQYSIFVKASKAVNKEGLTITEIGSNGQELIKKNPNVTILNQAGKEMKSIAGSMGMTLDSRMRLVAPKQNNEETDAFAKFLTDDDG